MVAWKYYKNSIRILRLWILCSVFGSWKTIEKKYARKETLPGLARKSSRFKHRTFTIPRSIRYLSRYPPPFSTRLLSFSRFLPPRANVSIFSLSWRNTLDRRKDVRKYGNRAEKRARLPRIVLIRPRLRQFPTEFSNRFEFPCEFSPREKFLPIFTEKNTAEKSVPEEVKVLRVE